MCVRSHQSLVFQWSVLLIGNDCNLLIFVHLVIPISQIVVIFWMNIILLIGDLPEGVSAEKQRRSTDCKDSPMLIRNRTESTAMLPQSDHIVTGTDEKENYVNILEFLKINYRHEWRLSLSVSNMHSDITSLLQQLCSSVTAHLNGDIRWEIWFLSP